MYSDNKKREVGLTCLLKARNYVKVKNWARAFPHYLMCLELFENDQTKFEHEFTEALYQLGIWLESNNKLTDICKWYIKGLEYFPSNANILNNFAEHLLRIEEPHTALIYLETAHEIDSNSILIERNLTASKLNIIPRWHYRMLNDKKRNEAFKNAIIKLMLPEHSKVLDIGTGCGLLSFYASQCRDIKITAIESNYALSKIAATIPNINVINKYSTSLNVQDVGLHNILITEIFDTGLFGEHALESLIHAWDNLLDSSVKIVPHSADVFVTGFNSPDLLKRHKLHVISTLGLNDVCVTQRLKEPYEAENLKIRKVTYVTNSYKACTVFFNDVSQLKNIYTNVDSIPDFSLHCIQSGTIDGFVIWFSLYLDEDNVITTNPCENNVMCWEQAIIYLDHPITLQAEDEVMLKLTCVHNELKVTVLNPVIKCSFCFKVSSEMITYLNDANVINTCNFKFPEEFQSPVRVVDLNPFPVFALRFAKCGYGERFMCVLKDPCDWEFINYVCNCNGVNMFEVVREGEVEFKAGDLLFISPISKNGTLNDCIFQQLTGLQDQSSITILPDRLIMHIEVIESEYLELCHKVDDSNLCGLVIAHEMNKYSVYEHWEIEPKHFSYASLGGLDLETDLLHNDINTTISVKVKKGCTANAVLYWFTMYYSSHHFTTFNSLHYNSACFMLPQPTYLSDDELNLTIRKEGGLLHIGYKQV